MYSKFFLVFFSLFLLVLSGLASNFSKRGDFRTEGRVPQKCQVQLAPTINLRASHFQMVREVICDK
jgi:hypothetical protein